MKGEQIYPSGDYVPGQADFPSWVEAIVASLSLIIGTITGAVSAAWNASKNLQAIERRITDKIDVSLDALRRRQDEMHRETKVDLQRLDDKISRRPMRQN